MKFLLAFAVIIATALAAPQGDATYDPYVWRPGKPIDMSKVQSINPTVNPVKAFNNPNKVRRNTTPVGFKPSTFSGQDNCGIENASGKIVGGGEAEPNQFPWLAVVLIGGSGLCTGSLVHPNWVLTAGHCVTASSYTIQLGAHDRTTSEANKVEIDSTESFQHENYNPITLQGDMGLIKLPQAAELNQYVSLSCLPTRSDATNSFEGDMVTITGWGKTHDVGAASSTLQYARDRPIIANSECITYYPLNVYDTTICTDTSGSIGTCNGDSGGPMNLQRAGQPYLQIGVTSYVSSAGCESGNPDGFSRVTEYLDWLETTSGGDIVIGA